MGHPQELWLAGCIVHMAGHVLHVSFLEREGEREQICVDLEVALNSCGLMSGPRPEFGSQIKLSTGGRLSIPPELQEPLVV